MKVPLGKSISKYGKGSLSSGLNGKPSVFSYKPLSDVLIKYTVAQARLKENSAKWVVEKDKLEEQLKAIRSEIAIMKKKVDEKDLKRKKIMQVLSKERQRRLGQQETLVQTQEPNPHISAENSESAPIYTPLETASETPASAPAKGVDDSSTPMDQTPTLVHEKSLYECNKIIAVDSKFESSAQERVKVPFKEWESLLAEQASFAPTLQDALSIFMFGDTYPDWAAQSGIDLLEKNGISDNNSITQLYQAVIHTLNNDVLFNQSQDACHVSSILQVLYDKWQKETAAKMDDTA